MTKECEQNECKVVSNINGKYICYYSDCMKVFVSEKETKQKILDIIDGIKNWSKDDPFMVELKQKIKELI